MARTSAWVVSLHCSYSGKPAAYCNLVPAVGRRAPPHALITPVQRLLPPSVRSGIASATLTRLTQFPWTNAARRAVVVSRRCSAFRVSHSALSFHPLEQRTFSRRSWTSSPLGILSRRLLEDFFPPGLRIVTMVHAKRLLQSTAGEISDRLGDVLATSDVAYQSTPPNVHLLFFGVFRRFRVRKMEGGGPQQSRICLRVNVF